MKKSILKALERTEKGCAVRKSGFIPGIVYAKDFAPTQVKFEINHLLSILHEKGERATISVEINGEERLAIVKELGRNISDGKIIHIDLQLIHGDEEIKRTLPIKYNGRQLLKSRGLYLQVYVPNVEVFGQVNKIPEIIEVDVTQRKIGEKITIGDLNLSSSLKPLQPLNTALCAVARF